TGSLGASPENDLPAMVRRLGGRIHFAHCRNVRITGDRQFHETAHPSPCGSVDLFQVLCALRDVGFAGPMRPDHGRMIWGETGRPGYGLYDRALGVTYLQGLWEALRSEEHTSELQSPYDLVCRLLLEKKKKQRTNKYDNCYIQMQQLVT